MSEEEQECLRREVEVHQRLQHPCIIHLYELYETANDLCLVLEWANAGTLHQVNTPSSECAL